MFRVVFYGKSDVGLRRRNNEDTFVVSPEFNFGLVSDGMGGEAAGELASRMFAETSTDVFSGSYCQSEEEASDLVQKSFRSANKKILDHVKDNTEHEGMGCTAELISFFGDGFVIGHIGDSRTYRLRNGRFKQLTSDHSLVQDQINQGLISPAEARNHSFRNVLLLAVGINERIDLDLLSGKIFSQDIFLLCSDGLTDMVDDSTIWSILSSKNSLNNKVDELVDVAKDSGGKDNITVVLCEILNP